MPPAIDIVPVPAGGTYDGALADRLSAGGTGRRVGIESDHCTVRRWRWLTHALDGAAELVPSTELIERTRMVKDAHEIALFRTAGRMLADAVPLATGAVRVGWTELAVAREIDAILLDAGFEALAFETIVAAGPNGALPHAHPGERRIEAGDLVLLDFGGVHHGYCVDLSRTVAADTVPAEARRLHHAVVEAQAAAMAAARPGVRAGEVTRLPARPWRGMIWRTRSATAPAMVSASRCTSCRASAARARPGRAKRTTWSLRPAWSSRSSRASTCRKWVASGSRTTSS